MLNVKIYNYIEINREFIGKIVVNPGGGLSPFHLIGWAEVGQRSGTGWVEARQRSGRGQAEVGQRSCTGWVEVASLPAAQVTGGVSVILKYSVG
jgi:hypothetical protein